jgi:AmmeMemoRadiSam system protein B
MKWQSSSTEASDVRRFAVAGTFYPRDPAELSATVERLTSSVHAMAGKKIRGIIAPHAGYMYSGQTAGAVYGRLKGSEYKTVVVVAPSHREFFEDVSAFEGSAYATPLGEIAVDRDLRDELIEASPVVHASLAGHRSEHAVEVHLPFLQKVLTHFSCLPLVIGHQTPEVCFGLGNALGEILKRRDALVVASTDLSHFYPDDVAKGKDAVMIDDVARFDEQSLMAHLENGSTEACGGGPTVAVLAAMRNLGANCAEIVAYATSGDVTGDRSSVVGYLGAIVY